MRRLFLLFLALTSTVSASARADDAESCSIAYARGQEERLAGRLYNARRAFLQCASAGCSASVAGDCRRWVKEVETDLPTVRVTIRDEGGAPLESARLFIDGESISRSALPAPIVLEAGPHELRVEAPGFEPVRVDQALRPSDREVAVEVMLRRPPAASTKAPAAAEPSRPVPTASWIFAGVGALALGTSLYFGFAANDEYQELKSSCAPRCEPSRSDGMQRKAVISDVALATSLAAFTASAVFYF
jgi:hypothetical protein